MEPIWHRIGEREVERPFLSEQTRSDVASAVQDETLKFWQDHRATMIDALVEVVSKQRPQFEQAFRERWAGRLYERGVVPAWQAGEDEVLFAVQNYAHDFAAHRLLTAEADRDCYSPMHSGVHSTLAIRRCSCTTRESVSTRRQRFTNPYFGSKNDGPPCVGVSPRLLQ